jgi:chemotaxis methyl-accepting protein methylase
LALGPAVSDEARELLDAMAFIATDNLRESHPLTLLKRKAG